jgi:hypothetical protein
MINKCHSYPLDVFRIPLTPLVFHKRCSYLLSELSSTESEINKTVRHIRQGIRHDEKVQKEIAKLGFDPRSSGL